jgi:hypothetical protein
MKAPLGINSLDHIKNIARAILAANSIVKPSPGIAAVPARLAVTAAPAYPARPASLAVPATANTSGVVAGALYLDSPAYPANTAIPAIPAKPATPARAAVTPIAAVPATAAIVGVKTWQDAFKIAPFLGGSDLIVELPYSPKVYAQTLDLRASIAEVPGTSGLIALVKAFASSNGSPVPKSLEDYLYTEMVAAGAYIAPRFDPVRGLDFIQCSLSTTSELAALLAEPTPTTPAG